MNIMNDQNIRILMFYSLKGWALWHKINNIAKNQPADIKVISLKINSDFNSDIYDFIVVFDSFLTRIISKVPRKN